MTIDPAIGKPLAFVLGGVGAAWMMGVMVRASHRRAEVGQDGSAVLRFPAYLPWVGLVCGLLGLCIAIFGGIQQAPKSFGALVGVLLVGGGMAIGGAWLLIDSTATVVRVGPNGVAMADRWGEQHEIHWSAVAAVRFRPMAGYLVLDGAGGTAVQVSVLLKGLQSLVDQIKARVDEPKWSEALKGLEEYQKRQAGKA